MNRVLLLLVLTFSLCGQVDEEQPYFSLSSSRTFAPGEKATVELSAVDVSALDFRVYRVKDPLAFFGKLEDAHQFGGQAARPPREFNGDREISSLQAKLACFHARHVSGAVFG